MSIGELCTLITTIVTAFGAIIPAVIAVVKLVKNKQWDAIKEIADRAMKQVEDYSKTHPEMKGEDKLNMAVEIVANECSRLTGVKWDATLVENLKKYITACINWVNEMNK